MYLSKELAIKIRDRTQDELKHEFPSINRMSLLATGDGYYLEIGICKTAQPDERERLDKLLGRGGNEKLLAGPDELQAPGPLTVVTVTTGDMCGLAGDTWTGDEEPVRGGHKIARESYKPGTLGCLVRLRRNGELDIKNTFFLSCWHVLSGDQVPRRQYLEWRIESGAEFSKHLGDLYWSNRDEHFDAAIGLVDKPEAKIGEGFAWSRIGACQRFPGTPVDGQAVIVCGHERRECGTVMDTNTHLWVKTSEGTEHMFRDQIRTDLICEPGDSGAILFALSDSSPSPIPIGMAFYNSPSGGADDKGSTYYNNLQTLFSTEFKMSPDENRLGDQSFQIHDIIVGTEGAQRQEGPDDHPAEPKK